MPSSGSEEIDMDAYTMSAFVLSRHVIPSFMICTRNASTIAGEPF